MSSVSIARVPTEVPTSVPQPVSDIAITATNSETPLPSFDGYTDVIFPGDAGLPCLLPKNYQEMLLSEEEIPLGVRPSFIPLEPLLPTGKKVAVSETLVKKQNYYIVPFDDGTGGKFYYYPVKVEPQGKDLLKFTKFPGIFREGFLVVPDSNKKLIFVTISDLTRRVARLCRDYSDVKTSATYNDFINGTYRKLTTTRTRSERAKSSSTDSDSQGTGEGSRGSENQLPGSPSRFGDALSGGELSDIIPGITMDELSGVDLAFENQVESLLHSSFN